jgi:hypothetical protein
MEKDDWQDVASAPEVDDWQDVGTVAAAPEPKADRPLEFGDDANFMRSMIGGSAIAEHMPGGKAVSDLGTKIGSGIAAATEAPFSDQSVGQLYDRNMQASQTAENQRSAYDAESPLAEGTKDVLGGIAVAPMKKPPLTGEAALQKEIADFMKKRQATDAAAQAAKGDKMRQYFKKGALMVGEEVPVLGTAIRMGRRMGVGK